MRTVAAAAAALALLAVGAQARGSGIRVPRGFRVDVFAKGLTHPTAMAWGPRARLYVTEDTGRLVVVDGGRPHVAAAGLRVPLGLVWWGRTAFVSEQGRLERLRFDRRGRVRSRRTIVGRLPYGLHQQDNVVIRRKRLYFGSGSTCDACRERDRRSAAILAVRMNGRGLHVVASGLRNPYGLALQPRTGRLYASVNGQDELGAREPAETIVRVVGGHWYGWPRCWPSIRRHRRRGSCGRVTPPAAYLEAHSSADGIAFWRGDLYVAEWGQYYSRRAGRRLVRIRLNRHGNARRISTFATGFDHPLALARADDALLVADWGRGVIYRIKRGS